MTNSLNHEWQQSTSAAGQEQSIDELFDVLQAEQRRAVLSILSDRRRPMDVESLAEAVAARGGAPEEGAVRRVHVRLHHVHLPKLDEAALVDYDRETGTVKPTATDVDGVTIDLE